VGGPLELREEAGEDRPVVATIRPPENAVVLDAVGLLGPPGARRVFTSEFDVLDRLGRVVRWDPNPTAGWDRRVVFVGPPESVLLSLHVRDSTVVVRDATHGVDHAIDPDAEPVPSDD
jgi:hypothetical protein